MKRKRVALLVLIITAFITSCSVIDKMVLSDGRAVYQKKDSADLAQRDVIEGCIVDASTNKPIQGVVVEIKNANFGLGYYRLETDSAGCFRVDNFIKHVVYRIEATTEGYITYRHTEAIRAGRYDIRLQREGILTGVIKDSSGSPVSGVEIRLRGTDYVQYADTEGGEGREPISRPLIAATDAHGHYRFNKLSAGSYTAAFEKSGYIKETAQIKDIKHGETFSLPMQMFRPASIGGKISIQGIDAPAVNIDVTLKGRATHAAVSYPDGSYAIEDVKPGNYKLSLSHRGFYSKGTDVIAIREGESKKNLNFMMTPKEASAEVYTDRYTFAVGQPLTFNLKTFRLEKAKARLYKVPMDILLKGRVNPNDLKPGRHGLKMIREWEALIKDFTPYEWREQSLDALGSLPAGGYCIEVAGSEKIINRKFFSVTSVGVVVKRSRESVFAYVTDLVANKPVPNASVILFDITPKKKDGKEEKGDGDDGRARSHRRYRPAYKPPERIEDLPIKIMDKSKTGKDGTALFSIKSNQHLSILTIGADGGYAFCNTGSPDTFIQEKNKFFIYTDRPVYRAGDMVFFKIIGKARDSRFIPLDSTDIHYEIKNVDANESLDRGAAKLDEWGTFNNSLHLDADAGLGTHEIRVGTNPARLYGVGRFYVDQYRKPEFKIDITPAKSYFTNRDNVEFKVEAKYLFGSPLKGALLRYRFYESRLRDADTNYWWEEERGESESYNRIKLEGDKYLDDNGIAMLRLSSGDFPYDREITLEATVMDKSNVSITGKATVKVGRGDYYIKINPVRNFFADTEKKDVELRTITHDGKPRSSSVDIKVYRYIWKPWQRVYVHDRRPLFEKTIVTDSSGAIRFELPKRFDSYGEFDITATGKDTRDNIITASRVVWIYSDRAGARVDSRFKNLELTVSDAKLEKPGEITALVKSRFADGYVCLTVEGRDIHERKVMKMNGNVLPVKITIRGEYAPNVFITATMQRNRALYTTTAEVILPNPDTAMEIRMKPDRDRYMPGEKATVQITATDEKGAPVKADLSLGVVDEAIYLIRRDHTPKMRDFFYSKISNWVLTNYSYPFTILAGAGKEGKVKIREKFADTAYWKADIKTDARGTAVVDFNVPDNLTTWRLTARGHDREGRVGERKENILVTQDLIARIGKPRFFIEGDTVGLIGIVNSNTTRGLPQIATEFKVNGDTLPPDEKTNISLPAYGSASEYYTVKVPEGKKSLDIFFQAVGDSEAKDALKIPVSVFSRGVNYKLYGVGDMVENRNVEMTPLRDTEDFEFKPEELVISLNPDPVSQLLRASKYLAEYPYGCIEQTINRFLPALALKNLLKQKGLEHRIADAKLDDKIKVGLDRMEKEQNSDGAWGWWSGDRGNEFITGYVLYAFHTAKSLGYEVDKETVAKGIAAAERMLKGTNIEGDEARSFLLYNYSLWGKWDSKAFDDINKSKDASPYRLAFLIKAMANVKKLDISKEEKKKIDEVLQKKTTVLRNMLKKDRFGVYWEPFGNRSWEWPGGATEITAHVLSALIEAGDRSPLPSQIVASLMKRSKGDAWISTKETASVFFAVCKYLEAAGVSASGKGDIRFTMGDKEIAAIAYDTNDTKDVGALSKRVKLDSARKGKSFQVAASGNAGADVSFGLTLSGNLYFRENRFLSLFKSEDRSIKSLENGIGLFRSFALVTRVRDINNNEYLVPQDFDKSHSLKVGDEILVKIKFRAQDSFEYLVLEDFLPAGFEVVRKNAYDDYQPYSRSERWDNRMVFFFTKINKDAVYEIAYTMRAELPGNFLVKPARMECMYEPSIQGWSAPARFTVLKK